MAIKEIVSYAETIPRHLLILTFSFCDFRFEQRDRHSETTPSPLQHEDSLANAVSLTVLSITRLQARQKFASFKRELGDNQEVSQSQLRKLEAKTKASNVIQFKRNRIQFELNVNILDQVESATKKLRAGNISHASSDIEEVKKRYSISAANLFVSLKESRWLNYRRRI